jgi:hypothetical protein
VDDRAAAQKARNEAVFRDANEKIRTVRETVEFDGPTPFLCECEDPRCRTILLLTLEEYEYVRADPTRFAIAAGHPTTLAEVVESRDGYDVVEKYGVSGAVAEETDPRERTA